MLLYLHKGIFVHWSGISSLFLGLLPLYMSHFQLHVSVCVACPSPAQIGGSGQKFRLILP